ncbi:hypothetical protein N0V90_010286 [Kalmusia sp. IMI 367209]|nr:hypothetical protein N0V90_010286 [Kalmusia sp. IMI 367209]
MAFLFNWLKNSTVTPQRVPTDTIVPLHYLDGTKTNAGIVMDFSMQFDHVLDVEKLVGALEKLLEKPGWRKLGARIRINEAGKYEYHIPSTYTKERRAINFSHAKHDISLSEHPIGSRLPRADGSIVVSPNTKEFRSLFMPKDSPTNIKEWLYTDRAQLCLHVVSFVDATLVSLTWVHTLLDATSRQMLFAAWTATLEGREQDVPDFHGELSDPLATLGTDSKLNADVAEEEYVLKGQEVTGWSFFKFVFNMMWEVIMHRTEEAHYVILPPAFFAKLRASALADLASMPPGTIVMDTSDPKHPKPFLSDGDILCAWWNRLMTSCLPTTPSASPTHTIQILNVFNMRPLFTSTAPTLLPRGKAYIGNCVSAIHTFFTLREMLSLPLGVLAARLRSDLVRQATRPQIEAKFALQRAGEAKSGYSPVYGQGDMQISAFSNWHKARMFDVDFTGAVVGGGDGRAEGKVAKPSYVMPNATANGIPLRNSGVVRGGWAGQLVGWRDHEAAGVEGGREGGRGDEVRCALFMAESMT